MIEKLLRKFGYIHESKIDDAFVSERIISTIGNPTEYVISKDQDKEFFIALEKVDGVREYLKATAAKDMVRYFGAQDEKEQLAIRGGFARTVYLLSRLRNVKEVEPQTKIKNLRYSK